MTQHTALAYGIVDVRSFDRSGPLWPRKVEIILFWWCVLNRQIKIQCRKTAFVSFRILACRDITQYYRYFLDIEIECAWP